MSTPSGERLHGIDAVRGLALLAGVVLHAAMSFLPGPQLWVVADSAKSTTLSVSFFVIHVARMAVFFLIAGFFGRMVLHRVGLRAFAANRLRRIAIPLVVGWPLVFGAIMVVMGAALPPGGPKPSLPTLRFATFPLTHLWFLYLLLILYAAVLLGRGLVSLVDRGNRLAALVDRAIGIVVRPWSPVLLAVPVAAALYYHPYWVMWFGIPTPDSGFVPNRAAVVTYGLAVVTGWLIQRQPASLLPLIGRRCWHYLVLAIAATSYCLATTSLQPWVMPVPFGPAKLHFAIGYSIALWAWTFAVLGLGLRFLNGHSPIRRYLADASYWIYLAHLPLVMALQLLVRDWSLAWPLKFAVVLGVSLVTLIASYNWLVRPTAIGAVLNGRRYLRYPRPGRIPLNPGVAP